MIAPPVIVKLINILHLAKLGRSREILCTVDKALYFFHDKRHPKEMGGAEISAFLTHLAVNEQVVASTQNQALSALLFLYREVLQLDIDLKIDAVRAKRPRNIPTVLTIGFIAITRGVSNSRQAPLWWWSTVK